MNIQPVIDFAKPLFTLDLFRTLIGAAFGTFAGAWISSRAERKKTVIAEINSVSAAIELSINICNRFMTLKKQIIRPFRDRFLLVRTNHEAYLAAPQTQQFQWQTDFQTISQVTTPTEALERCVFEETSVRGRALAAAVELIAAINALHGTIDSRNNMIEEYRKNGLPPNLLETYLGLPTPQGVIDQRFSTNVDALYAQTDQCIFFARLLATDLVKYGNKKRRRYIWQFRLGMPKIKPTIWKMAEAENLLPPDADFKDWMRGFQVEPTKLSRLKTWLWAQFH